ncbi:hypothetical protein [Oceanobacillus kapialis]|uniref:ABC transporter permease n=1 Tax=Oceanobacillus kapialis TaxID=481353 RepID=A0ABW5PZL3_9BACI
MGRQLTGLLYFYSSNYRDSLKIFWTILLSILIVTLSISYFLLNVEGAKMAFSFTAPMYVYCGIIGFISVKDVIPFAIKVGATRKNLYLGLAIFFLLLSVGKAFAGSIIQILIINLGELVGINNFEFLHLAYFMEDTWYTRFIIDAAIMFFCLTLFFLLGLLFYRFGFAGAGSVLGLLLVGMLFAVAKGWAWDFMVHVAETFDMMFFLQLTIISIVLYILSFFLVRRITV